MPDAASDPERSAAFAAAIAPQPPGTGELAPGAVTAVTPLVRRIVAPNPSLMTGPGTNTYLVGDPADGDLVVIDPGPDVDAHLDRIAEIGAGRIRTIVVTHTHQDHSPGAPGLAARTGAPLVGFDGRDGFEPDRAAGDGHVVEATGARLVAVHTPGHASNHLCWLLEEERLLVSGDHVMDGSTVVIAPPDGDMAAYLDQLRRLRALGLRSIAPGHGRLITDPDARLDGYLSHRLDREHQVVTALASAGHPATVEELVAAIYTGVAEALLPVARYSVWAHLRKLAAELRAESRDPDDVGATWIAC
jgi:glyoxylase-like metal-dependent hydrolase (beta-lactamase superfamily II)